MSGRVHVTVTIAQARFLASLETTIDAPRSVDELRMAEAISRSARRALDWRERKHEQKKDGTE